MKSHAGSDQSVDPADVATHTGNADKAYDRGALWEHYERRPEAEKAKARERLNLLMQVMRLNEYGHGLVDAMQAVGRANAISWRTIRGWYHGSARRPGVKRYAREDWLAALVPGYCGRIDTAECSAAAWDLFKSLYLHRSRPTLATCWRRVYEAAIEHGWSWPSRRTIERRVQQEIPARVRVALRDGPEALDRMIPSMRRDRTGYEVLEAVNGDGKVFGPYCLWPDGQVERPHVWFWQDLRSGALLTWRADVSENRDMLRLAFGDLVERYGIPRYAFIDNTTAAANKWMTGGTTVRYRWKIRDEDPLGIMPQVGTDVHFVQPGRGQSKPVERTFRGTDLPDQVDRHPALSSRGTKGRPIPIDEFLEVLAHEVQRFNRQTGRRSHVAQGRSYQEVFDEGYAQARIRRATDEQRRLWLLAADKVRADRETGAVRLGRGPQGENRYWHERLTDYRGQLLVVRFDPAELHTAVHVYTLDGRHICHAPCTWSAGFGDTDAARAYHRYKRRFKRATKQAAEAQRGMDAAVKTKLPQPDDHTPPPARVIEGQFRRRAVGDDSAEPDDSDEPLREGADAVIRRVHQRWVEDNEGF